MNHCLSCTTWHKVQVQAELAPRVLPNTTVYPFEHNLLSSLSLKMIRNKNVTKPLSYIMRCVCIWKEFTQLIRWKVRMDGWGTTNNWSCQKWNKIKNLVQCSVSMGSRNGIEECSMLLVKGFTRWGQDCSHAPERGWCSWIEEHQHRPQFLQLL